MAKVKIARPLRNVGREEAAERRSPRDKPPPSSLLLHPLAELDRQSAEDGGQLSRDRGRNLVGFATYFKNKATDLIDNKGSDLAEIRNEATDLLDNKRQPVGGIRNEPTVRTRNQSGRLMAGARIGKVSGPAAIGKRGCYCKRT